MNRLERALKRTCDVAAAAATLGASAPALVAIAALIRLDSPGPALFRQERLGRNGRVFRIYKFRTMFDGVPTIVGSDGRVVNREQDNRHTRVGRILRNYSLDELPQLLNVVAGDMSLVGPRPDLPGAHLYDTPETRIRLTVRPGITGLAQVRGRNALSTQEKWRFDADYARTASLGLDARILVETVFQSLVGKGVYAG